MSMEVIQHVELTSAQAGITLSSIPASYTDLYLVLSLRGSSSSNRLGITIGFNSDTSALYSYRLMFAYESGQLTDGLTSKTPAQTPSLTITANNATANAYGVIRMLLPSYASSANKTFIADYVAENNSTTSYVLGTQGENYASSSAISSIELGAQGHNFMQYSSATLYGITSGSDGSTTVS